MILVVACEMYGLLRLHDCISYMLHHDYSFLPISLWNSGVPKADVALWSGLVFGITFLMRGIMAPIWGKIADNKGKKRMALRAGFGIAVCYVLIGLVTDQYQLLMGRASLDLPMGFIRGNDYGIPQCR